MKNFIIFLSLLFCSCYSNEYLGDDISIIPNLNYVYIYDDTLYYIHDDSCNVAGVLNDNYFINRRCKLINGNIEIGTKHAFREQGYQVNINVYLKDTLYTNIVGYKKIIYNL